jgi:glycogenin glucosyltransferase
VLAHSLRDNGTKKKLAVLITVDSLRSATITELKVRLSKASSMPQD